MQFDGYKSTSKGVLYPSSRYGVNNMLNELKEKNEPENS